MANTLNRLNVRQISVLTKTGRHSDGGGLYLRITASGSRSWVFMSVRNGKRIEIGLGPASSLSLATARRIATDMREAVGTGNDPRGVIAPHTTPAMARLPTFGEFAEEYIASVEAGWKNAVHRQQWRSSLRDHAAALRDVPVDQIATRDVIAVLDPIWRTKPETAKRVRARIEKILDAAKAREFRAKDSTNPAALRGHLALLLPSQKDLQRGHHAALPYAEAPAFMAELRQRAAPAARCLEFVILTAARSSEALEATWGEVDMAAALWTVPASRMKAGKEHVVPLSTAALQLLKSLQPGDSSPSSPVFGVKGVARSNMAMAMLLRRMKRFEVTTHGFRSTFRDWAGEETEYPRDLIEMALAHTLGSKVEQAYRRKTGIQRRRQIMESWASYLSVQPQRE